MTAALALTTGGLPLIGAAYADAAPASISSDQADYPPGGDVTLTGAGWNAGDNVHVVVDDIQGQTWQWQGDAVAGDGGGFDVQFTLPDWFVADYSVLADNGTGTTATTTFTDSNVQVAAKVGTTSIVAGVAWTTYRRNTTCSGTTLNNGNVSTVTNGNGFTGTSGVGNTTAMSLQAATPVVYSGRVYTFSSWTGDLPGSAAFLCVPGDTLNGKISETALYTDSGPATKTAQTITFNTLSDKVFGDADFNVSATASSGLTVTFTASGPCTVTGTLVHLTGVGDCTITADQAGNTTYYPAPSVPRSFTITSAATTVTVTCPPSVTYTSLALEPCTAAVTGTNLNQALTVTYTNNVNVGTATASASYAGDSSHDPSSNSATFAITQASSTTTITCPASVTYTGSAQTPCSASVSGAGLSLTPTPSYSNNTAAGTATASYTYAGDANHTGSSDSKDFAIGVAGTTTTVTCPTSAVYTGSALTPCSATVTGANLSLTPTPTYSNNTNVGTATASYTYAGDANHSGSNDSKTFDITAASSSVVITCPGTFTYTGSALTPCTAKATGAGMSDVPLTVTYGANTAAGTATAEASWIGDGNHSGSSNSTTFTIGKAISTVTLVCPSHETYTGAAIEPCTATVAGANLSGSVPVTYGNNTNAGAATASATYAGDDNHYGDSDSGGFTIDPASSTIVVACPTSVVFDGSAQTPCTAKATGAGMSDVTGLTVTYSADHKNVGTVTASATWAGDANHTGNTGSSAFDITKASSTTVVSCPVSVTYNASAQTPCTVSVTGAGGLSLTPDASYTDNVSVGSATASYTYAGDGNHNGSNDTKHFTIGKANTTTTVTCPPSATYTGSAIEPCSASVTGPGLSQSLAVTYGNNTNAGSATASASYAGDSNLNGSSDNGGFTIDKASSTTTLTCPTTHQVYTGSAITPCTASATGAGISSPVSVTPVTYTNNTNAGTAGASATWTGDANHNGSTGTGSFVIDQASSTVSLSCSSNVTFTGAPIEPCNASVSGANLSQTLSVSYSNNTNAGTANASASYAGDANHTGDSKSTTFTIDQAGSSVQVTCPASVTYTGSSLSPCTAKATGVGMSDVTGLTVTYSADHTNVGHVTASASWTGDANHTGNTGSSGFDITAAVLTVTADDKSVQYSDATPALTATITGYLNGENASSAHVTGTPALSTSRVLESAPGGFTITCGVGSLTAPNYTFSCANGTLTVTKEDASIEYAGVSFFSAATSTATSVTAPVSAVIREAADGSLGSRLGSTVLTFSATPQLSGPTVTCTANVTASGPGVGSAGCNLTGLNIGDSYLLQISLNTNTWYTAPVEDFTFATYASGTGFASGGGWFTEPTLGSRSNLGFNVKYVKKGPQGSSLYIYRRTLTAPEVINGVTVPAGSYNWIIKSNAMTGMVLGCDSANVCTSSITGKSNIQAVNRATGVSYSLGGNMTFQLDVTDKGEPGSSSSTTPDTYALKVTGNTGTYYSVGTATAQVALKGGNIQVRP